MVDRSSRWGLSGRSVFVRTATTWAPQKLLELAGRSASLMVGFKLEREGP
jgi:hypothetical protein